jgi:hypothetical protein
MGTSDVFDKQLNPTVKLIYLGHDLAGHVALFTM